MMSHSRYSSKASFSLCRLKSRVNLRTSPGLYLITMKAQTDSVRVQPLAWSSKKSDPMVNWQLCRRCVLLLGSSASFHGESADPGFLQVMLNGLTDWWPFTDELPIATVKEPASVRARRIRCMQDIRTRRMLYCWRSVHCPSRRHFRQEMYRWQLFGTLFFD